MLEGLGLDGKWWFATNVSKPSVTISSTEHKLVNYTFKYPTTGVWNDITISIIDPGDVTRKLYDSLKKFGYHPADTLFGRNNPSKDGISKGNFSDVIDSGAFVIDQLDSSGKIIERWKLRGAFITDIKFGDLDYSSDNFVKLDLTVKYDWATLDDGDGLNDIEGANAPSNSNLQSTLGSTVSAQND